MQVDGRPPLTPMNATQVQSRDPVPAFARSPHDVPSLLPGTTARLIHDMPAMFQTPVDQPNVLAGVVADVMASPSQTLRPAPAFMPDYQTQVDSYRISTGLDNDSAMNSSSIHPPLPDPQVSPSAIHQINPGFAVSTSSLATALDSMAANTSRSRACSTASPGKHLPQAVFPMNGGVVSPMESAGVVFPAADFTGGINDCRDAAQEVHNDQLMVDVGHALTRFVSNPCAIGTVHKFVFSPSVLPDTPQACPKPRILLVRPGSWARVLKSIICSTTSKRDGPSSPKLFPKSMHPCRLKTHLPHFITRRQRFLQLLQL